MATRAKRGDGPSLFAAAGLDNDAPRPLADKLRPQKLSDVVGQDQLLGPDGALTRMLESNSLGSLIFWGPPGTGKTTVARLLANETELTFVQISAIFSGVADLKKVFDEARARRETGQGTLLFVDEIHRFNRAQQDSFLPYVEDGTVVLVGDRTIRALKLEHWGEDAATDVLSFPTWEPGDPFMPPHLGDIVISLDTAARQAQARGHALEVDLPETLPTATIRVSEQAQTDIATAFAEIDALSEDEKRALKEGRIPEAWAAKPAKLAQKDRDARWTVKYTKARPSADGAKRVDIAIPTFGYKNHVGIDRRHGLIRTWTTTDAARHDGAQLPSLLDRANTGSGVWADTAYRSAKNEAHLAEAGFASRIHRRKPKGKPMPQRTARANAAKSEVRSRVEHVFARQKGPMGLVVRTIGLARAKMKIGLANLVYNMRRMVWLAGPAPA